MKKKPSLRKTAKTTLAGVQHDWPLIIPNIVVIGG